MAAQPLLNSGTMVAMLKLLPEPSQGLPRVEANEEEDSGVGKHEKFELERREIIIGVLLEFPSRFLKKWEKGKWWTRTATMGGREIALRSAAQLERSSS